MELWFFFFVCLNKGIFVLGALDVQVLRASRMKMFSVKVEEGREGRDGNPSVGPVYRNLLAKNGFPPTDADMCTAWDVFRYFTVGAHSLPE